MLGAKSKEAKNGRLKTDQTATTRAREDKKWFVGCIRREIERAEEKERGRGRLGIPRRR